MRRDGGPGTRSRAASPTHGAEPPPLDPAAREELITANLGLAHQLARRFLHRGEPLDDLVQVASVALVKSVDRFDPSRGVDFAAFATRTIIGELKRHFRDKGWAVRASRRVQELYLELGHATATLVQQLGRNPTVAELAEATGASEEAVIEAIEAGQGYRAASIDASESEDDPLSARLGEHDANYDSVEDRALLGPALATLPATGAVDPAHALRRRPHPVGDRRRRRGQPDARLPAPLLQPRRSCARASGRPRRRRTA